MKIGNRLVPASKSAEQIMPEKNSPALIDESRQSVYSTTHTTLAGNVSDANEAQQLRFQLKQCAAQLGTGNQPDILRLAAQQLIHSRLAVTPRAARITRDVSDFAAADPLLSARLLAILKKLS